MIDQIFSEEQLAQLQQVLDNRLVSERKGAGKMLRYIEGHDAIDQANRIFGYGNWAYRPLSCEQTTLFDPLTGEAVGVTYQAEVELQVRGCLAPIVEVGSQPVAVWSVEEHVMKKRLDAAKYQKKAMDEGPFTWLEKSQARKAIVDAHEMAEKGAVTDGLKRALRTFGEQFGNGLYGDGRVDIDMASSSACEHNGQSGKTLTLDELIIQAKNRALKLKVAANTKQWQQLLEGLNIAVIQSEGDLARINEHLMQYEAQPQPSQK